MDPLGAAHSFEHISDKKTVGFLIPLLTDSHHDLRVHPAWAWGKIGDPRVNRAPEKIPAGSKGGCWYQDGGCAGIIRGEKLFMTPPLLKPLDDVQIDLKNYLQEMDLEISKEFASDELNGFWTRSGDFRSLSNRKPLKYYVIAFQITFSDEAIINALNDYYDRQDHQFIFRLTQVLTSSLTSS